ncbi:MULTISPECIES: hypothetical protein [Streptomyces]|uniref:Uncharacterized protein n=2 Tax=Streptomyces TaxID=1883 RepID=A0ABU4KDL0_9ACTN|nr:hypothetical protein [Streptomyces roseolus]MDX2295882.1 hypothetical protein [Streptomyces roseolus]
MVTTRHVRARAAVLGCPALVLALWPVLKTGSRGTDVFTAQHLLAARGQFGGLGGGIESALAVGVHRVF